MRSTWHQAFFNLSLWAKNHPVKGRLIIAAVRTMLGYIFIHVGILLYGYDFTFYEVAYSAAAILFVTACFFYPKNISKINFLQRKICDALLVATSCLFWAGSGNYIIQWQARIFETPVLLSAIAKDEQARQKETKKLQLSFFEKYRDPLLKKIQNVKDSYFRKTKAKTITRAGNIKNALRDLDTGTTILLVLASLAIITVLGFLVIALSCSLSCNGQEGLAIVVAWLGCFAIAGIVFWMWWAAFKTAKRKKLLETEEYYNVPIQTEIQDTEIPPVTPSAVHLNNPNFRLCVESFQKNQNPELNLTFGKETIAQNLNPGAEEWCADLSLHPAKSKTLAISGSQGIVKITIQDGLLKKIFYVDMKKSGTTYVNLLLQK